MATVPNNLSPPVAVKPMALLTDWGRRNRKTNIWRCISKQINYRHEHFKILERLSNIERVLFYLVRMDYI
jgi:hypothetical protein